MEESLEKELKKKMNVKYIQQAYAMTEAAPITIKCLKSTKKGTCGTVAPATQVKVKIFTDLILYLLNAAYF